MPLFEGSAVALVTPFTKERVDFDAYERLIDRQLAAGTRAIVALGTTGEPSTLSDEEKREVVACAVARVGKRVPVIAGVGGNDTHAVCRQARLCQELGADAALAVTPYYNKTTQRGLLAHFRSVAEAGELPLILYNVPPRTGLNLLPETAAALSKHPRIVGLKDACADIAQSAETIRLVDKDFAVYAGNDEAILPMLALGARGVVSVAANVAPGLVARLAARWFAGDIAGARTLQFRLAPLVSALFSEVNPIPVKHALRAMGLCEGALRLPLVDMGAEPARRLEEALRALLRAEEAEGFAV